jgi:hypothetical protein
MMTIQSMHQIISPISTKKTPRCPGAANNDQGDRGRNDGSEQGEIGPFAQV